MNPSTSADLGQITVITFDAAGTLLRPHPSVGEVYRAIALRHGCDLEATRLEHGFRDGFQRVPKDRMQVNAEQRERRFWHDVVHHACTQAGATPAPFGPFFDELWEEFARGARWRVLPGAREVLQTLLNRGYRLAVLSNWDIRLHRVLEETELRPYFAAVLISSEVGAEKPEVAIFRAAERVLGAPPGQCLHVGDSPGHDLAGASAAGWTALLVRHDDQPADPTCEINQLTDLLPRLRGPAPGNPT